MSNRFEVSPVDVVAASDAPRFQLRRIGILSATVIGVTVGLIDGLFMVFAGGLSAGINGGFAGPELVLGPMFLVIGPIMYGVTGIIGGFITSVVYNIVAGMTDGLEIQLDPQR